ncbi:PREDICTED: two-component response regulator-like APRR1 [Nicotiana attenuata]|uniref:Timing of cab expression 1/pseudo-response regulator 1 n=1 Tax=Nicotiana attenuata TaxID=49451 RepID=J9PWT0_NICAT|nr:PREDICTED: two-component response regulator-like APRR1 [Nicotiana attenuata]AFA35965.1 timing of cab expression 1/pseudo-response regulator 1 [Nicotiana attenuata]OIT29753.1 two-component response regulator-like aprr1 [Nicotiana attenuata]
MEKSEIVKSGEGFIDRSKVRILLCDKDAKSSQEVFTLLCKCSYQVTSARSPRQVIDALNAEGPEIDIILSEVDLPMSKGYKMLKYIMRDKELRRIPVIMMSAQDEVSIVVKCLKFGAADYLVKPLRTNELLNLWTHMWRRRQMLGLAEKNILSYDFDLVVSDPSDPNTNSTTLFSDDTDDRSRKSVNLEACPSIQQEDEVSASTTAAHIETTHVFPSECQSDVPGTNERQTGHISLFPKKSELKIGGSSAFFTYVKSGVLKTNEQGTTCTHENVPQLRIEEKSNAVDGNLEIETQMQVNEDAVENHSQGDDYRSSNSFPESYSMKRSCTPPLSLELTRQRNSKMEEFSQVYMHPRNEAQRDAVSFHAQTAYSYFVSGAMNQVMMPSPHIYQKNLQDLHNHANSAVLPQYNHMPPCPPHMHGMASFPYYPMGLCLQPGQMPTPHQWPTIGNSPSAEGKGSIVDRRTAALMKFRQKRKERCFDKKIRYVNRKKLAERRPRVRGQFVRKVNGVNVDLNGHPASADYDDEEEEEEDEEEQTGNFDSPEDDPSMRL